MSGEEATLLIVDDEPHILKALERVFMTQDNWHLVLKESAQAALDWLETGTVDLIISDERMPGMSGSEFLARVKALRPEVPRIILTGHADQTATIRAINDAEVFRYLQKPWNNEELKQTVTLALEHARSLGKDAGLNLKLLTQKNQLQELNRRLQDEADQQKKKWDRAALVLKQVASTQLSHRTVSIHIFQVVTALHAPGVSQLAHRMQEEAKQACQVLGLEYTQDLADTCLLLPILGLYNSQMDSFLARLEGFHGICALILDARENYNATGPRNIPSGNIAPQAMLLRAIHDYHHYEKEMAASGGFMLHLHEYRYYDPRVVAALGGILTPRPATENGPGQGSGPGQGGV